MSTADDAGGFRMDRDGSASKAERPPAWKARRQSARSLLVLAKASAIVLLCFGIGGVARGPELEHEPLCRDCNVILISMDTLRADHLGAYGYGRPTSPNIDGLAARSILFENAISQSAWTRPAHVSMFTGLYPAEHGVISMAGNKRLPTGAATLAGALARAGYATAAFTGGANVSAHFGFDDGFDLYESNGRRFEDNFERLRQWLSEERAEPFFAFFHGFDSHKPYKSEAADREALGLSAERTRGMAAACRDNWPPEAFAPFVADYDAAVHRGDRTLGRLFDLIDELGLTDRTVVVFTSDHGEEFLEHGRCFHIRTLYREVLRVPLMIHVPGLTPSRVAPVVPASVTLAATILDTVGVAGHGLPNHSLELVLRGRTPGFTHVVSETASRFEDGKGLGHLRALTGMQTKLIDWLSLERAEFFDLVTDASEQRPMIDTPHGLRLARRLGRWVEDHPPVSGQRGLESLPSELGEQLRALGYLD